MTDYTKVDEAIVADIKDRARRGYSDFNRAIDEAQAIEPKNWQRVLDRRFQSLRRRGQVEFRAGMWRMALHA